MLPKYKQKSFILDKLHRGVVVTCMTVTVISFGALVYKGYYYYKYIRPAMKQVKSRADEELLDEGKYAVATG